MKITIISDNTVFKKGLKSEWGFAALVELKNEPRILFDTGADGGILLYNMEKLNIDPKDIDVVFISHNHWDHTGGIKAVSKLNPGIKLYFPEVFSLKSKSKGVIKIGKPVAISKKFFSTGVLEGVEQSLVAKLDNGVVVIAGCSHPGVGNILNASSHFGRVIGLIGGLHGFKDFDLVKDLDFICATHCTEYKEEIERRYPEKSITGGAGKIITV